MEQIHSTPICCVSKALEASCSPSDAQKLAMPRSPSSSSMSTIDDYDRDVKSTLSSTQGDGSSLSVRVCSWNLYGREVAEDDDLRAWLIGNDAIDVLVISVQELIELRPRSVASSLFSNSRRRNALETGIENVFRSAGLHFTRLTSFGMVGLGVLVYVRASLAASVRDVLCQKIPTGFGGLLGNKGCVSVAFCICDVSFRVFNVHLPSGEGARAAAKRNATMENILGRASGDAAITIVVGDFNSRVLTAENANGATSRFLEASKSSWHQSKMHTQEDWLQNDELLSGSFSSLKGFAEGPIRFAPTFQYIPGTDDFGWERHPAWCDRAVFKSSHGAKLDFIEYDAFHEVHHTSDHRPIAAQLTVTCSSEW